MLDPVGGLGIGGLSHRHNKWGWRLRLCGRTWISAPHQERRAANQPICDGEGPQNTNDTQDKTRCAELNQHLEQDAEMLRKPHQTVVKKHEAQEPNRQFEYLFCFHDECEVSG